jgi:ribosomal protein L33
MLESELGRLTTILCLECEKRFYVATKNSLQFNFKQTMGMLT